MSMARSIKRQKQGAKSFDRMTTAERTQAMARFGIKPEDLQKSYDMGYADGQKDSVPKAKEFTLKACYASFLITMIDHFGMSMDDAVARLRDMDDQFVLCFNDTDMVEEAFEKTGVHLNWGDPLERIEEV